jgi:flagellar biosynthesis protein FliQ
MSPQKIFLLVLLIIGILLVIIPSILFAMEEIREDKTSFIINIVLIAIGAILVAVSLLIWYFNKTITFEACDTNKYASCVYDPKTGKIIAATPLSVLMSRSPQKFANLGKLLSDKPLVSPLITRSVAELGPIPQ